MIVDTHTHLWERPEQLGADIERPPRTEGQLPWERPEASSDLFLEAMRPVDYVIVHGLVSPDSGSAVEARQVARYTEIAPDRCIGFAGIDPMTDHAQDLLDEALELGLAGVTLSPPAQDFHPTHTRAMELYERCEARGVPIFVHLGPMFAAQTRLDFARAHLFDEAARSFPNLRMVIAQMGHPFVEQTLVLLGKHRHVYTDVTDVVERPWQLYNLLLLAHQMHVMDKVLLGSNFPFNTPENVIATLYSVNSLTQGTNLPSVPREQLRRVVERDALACLGLRPPGQPLARIQPAATPEEPGVVVLGEPGEPTGLEHHPAEQGDQPGGDPEHDADDDAPRRDARRSSVLRRVRVVSRARAMRSSRARGARAEAEAAAAQQASEPRSARKNAADEATSHAAEGAGQEPDVASPDASGEPDAAGPGPKNEAEPPDDDPSPGKPRGESGA